ncbi:glycosyltransferase [Murimonas intestini]|uniref:Glycosyl transferase family 2 n=1 Tax=Murimonas intestini TaxID=1337051 RepID=A0AB73T4M4_9FIRM|nr:glycosyltransferase [Murimonas intestini]MCR1840691.1 glycosyltransferase [Murimonas intestini]MCR1865256.1 glycosyltransferase [Murimonas intestini]MCR1883020.1 glycosyltransferase [Murimonas intestini]
MNNKLVSVIITTYKRPISVLRRAVESVVNQTYKNIEIIVVNDYPEDKKNAEKIKELLSKYHKRLILYLEPDHNSGACAARNLGLSRAKGTYISFLDDDDYWLERKIEVQLTGFESENIGVVYTPFYLKYKNKQKIVKTDAIDGRLTESLLYRNTMCIFPLMRTDLVRQVGGFDVKLTASQEHDLLLRLSENSDFKFIDELVAVYDISDISISMNIPKKIEAFEMFLLKHKKLYDMYPDAAHYQLIRMVNNMNNAGLYKYAFSIWKKALQIKPFAVQNITQPLKGILKRITGRRAFH